MNPYTTGASELCKVMALFYHTFINIFKGQNGNKPTSLIENICKLKNIPMNDDMRVFSISLSNFEYKKYDKVVFITNAESNDCFSYRVNNDSAFYIFIDLSVLQKDMNTINISTDTDMIRLFTIVIETINATYDLSCYSNILNSFILTPSSIVGVYCFKTILSLLSLGKSTIYDIIFYMAKIYSISYDNKPLQEMKLKKLEKMMHKLLYKDIELEDIIYDWYEALEIVNIGG